MGGVATLLVGMPDPKFTATKVPEVTLGFWIIKIAATTLGETGGDTVTMTLNWGYLAGTLLFLTILVVLVVAQILAKRFHPFLYWATIAASTTFGTTMADFADRSLGIGYLGGSVLLVCLLLGTQDCGTGRRGRFQSPRSVRQEWKHFTGRPSHSRKRLVPRWAIGSLIPDWGMKAELSCSLRPWRCLWLSTTQRTFHVYCCSGPPSF